MTLSNSVCFLVLAYRNSPADLQALFSSLSEGALNAGISSERVLVSNDDAFDQDLLRKIDVRTGHGNVGFARGIRIGVEAAQSEFIVIVNPDVIISPQAVTKFLSALIGQAGVLVPVLRNVDRAVAYQSYEDWVFSGGRMIAKHACRRFLLRSTVEILPRWVRICGAFVGMPTALAKEYGPFDDAFFMYGEDRDLTSRLRRNGVPILIVRSVSVTHFGGGSGAGMNRLLSIFRADSALRIAYRRYGTLGVWLKSLDLWLEAFRKRDEARLHAMAARRIAVRRWRASDCEPPRLDFATAQKLT